MASTNNVPTFDGFDVSTEQFSSWAERLENHLSLHDVSNEEKRKNAVISWMGADAYRKLMDRVQPERKPKDLSFVEIVEVLRKVYEPLKNKWSSRSAFRKVRQSAGESLSTFENRLRHAAVDCHFSADQLQERLIEQFTEGLEDKQIMQKILMKEGDFTKLAEVSLLANTFLSIRKATSAIHDNGSAQQDVNKISTRGFRKKTYQKPLRKNSEYPASSNQPGCYRCGDKGHSAKTCRYQGVKCAGCGLVGHLKKACRRTTLSNQNYLEEVPFRYVNSKDPIRVEVDIEQHALQMEIDTGSGISTMPLKTFRRIAPQHELHENNIQLRSATGEIFQPHSFANVSVVYGDQEKSLRLYLMENDKFPELIGRDWLRELPLHWSKLLTGENKVHHLNASNQNSSYGASDTEDFKSKARKLLGKYENLTKPGIGCIPNSEARLELTSEDPAPYTSGAHQPAEALIEKTNKELDFLEEYGVITKVNTSEWSHPMCVVPRAKGKKVRICGNFKAGINRHIKIDSHPLKNIRHALDNIGNGKTFSKLDVFSAFLHLPVREKDRKYLIVNTHRGLYQFNRMANGLSNAPAIWQRFIEGVLADIPGCECVMDDILVTGATNEEHLRRLDTVFSRLNEHDIRLNSEKCVFFEESVTYCGFLIKNQEIHKCDDKVKAIREAPSPKNASDLRSFLGIIQFYSGFAARLADLAHPLYSLLKSNAKFLWDSSMEKSFQAVKEELCSPRVLVPFDPKRPLLLATDASPFGISAVLSHRYPDKSERPIAYYSRVLTDTEKKYSQIDKEALGIKTGVERFFYYLFGRRFELITDSRPLVQIFHPSRNLPPLSATRMQHYSIYLLAFNFDIVYRKSEKHGNADALSRLPARSERLQEMDASDCFIVNLISETPLRFEEIVQETKSDPELKPLLKFFREPRSCKDAPRFFGLDACEFSLHQDSALLRGHRIVIPKNCREQVLTELHEGHYGERKMTELARRFVWWPNISHDIKALSRSCPACLACARNPPKEVIHSRKPCKFPFERIHLDYAGPIKGKYILLIVDAFSKWLEAFITNDKTSSTTLKHLKDTIARFGIPSVIVTDNDPTFVSEQMKRFCATNGIRKMTSPPFHPASNGQVERYVGTMKTALKKFSLEKQDLADSLARFLFRQRMVSSSSGESPASIMLGRELRSRLDLLREPSLPKPIDETESKFAIGEPVSVRDYRSRHQKWTSGRVKKNCGSRICEVSVPSGTWRRHYEQIRKRTDKNSDTSHELDCLIDCEINIPKETTGPEVPEIEGTPSESHASRDQQATNQEEQHPSEESNDDSPVGEEEPLTNESAPQKNQQKTTVRESSRRNKGVPPKRYGDEDESNCGSM
ncbi:uncharacterized protein K02A2.6-like [Galendromus occidentalis]|uniref:RNA-directed DNA polymerase n=1 Tax=Galendromus occidentalis TaxID=34638 RepID=A0AAJ6QLX8_9ACAR|nr:uncharacterized protein K02A2.6-like [Galendromus occidentalis]